VMLSLLHVEYVQSVD